MQLKAFTLVEILVAVTVLTVGIMASYAAITKVVSLTYFNSYRFIASRLAQEGMELVSNIRDSNWLDPTVDWYHNLDSCSGGCEMDYNDLGSPDNYTGRYLKINTDGFYNYDNDGEDSRFKRRIKVDKVSDYKLEVKVEIMWSEPNSSSEQILTAEEHLYDWR